MALIGSLCRVRAKSFWPADRAKIGTRAKIDGDGAGGGVRVRVRRLLYLGFHVTPEKKIKYLLLTEFEGRTVSYGTSFFPPRFMA